MDGEQGEPKKKVMLYSMYTSECLLQPVIIITVIVM